MSRKPTEPFGYIAFGKDGSVTPHIEKLPDHKAGQESEVGNRFAAGLSERYGKQYAAEQLPEDDHDFILRFDDREVIVQATEIAGREYLRPLPVENYVGGKHTFAETVHLGPDEILGVDVRVRDQAIVNRITQKRKRYAKPKDHPLWLLVWTVQSDFGAFFASGQQSFISPAVANARSYLEHDGPGPFAEIWFTDLLTSPNRIWPFP